MLPKRGMGGTAGLPNRLSEVQHWLDIGPQAAICSVHITSFPQPTHPYSKHSMDEWGENHMKWVCLLLT